MRIFQFSLFIFLLTALSSCGDSSSNATEINENSSSSKKEDTSYSTATISSSSTKISSSEQQSYSSSSSAKSDVSKTNYDPNTELLTDERDGKVYKTVKIGNQIWMAENLNFDIRDYKNTIVDTNDIKHGVDNGYKFEAMCPKSSTEEDCDNYGRLYTQKGFLLSLNDKRVYGQFPAVPKSIQPYQGVCPTGWHIPNAAEWQILFNNTYLDELRSVEFGGNNKSGFNVKATGFAYQESKDVYENSADYNANTAVFATVSEATAREIEGLRISQHYAEILLGEQDLHYAVRCLKD